MPASDYSKPGPQRMAFAGMCTVCAPDAQPPGKVPLAINVNAYLEDAITPRLPQGNPLVTVASGLVHSLRRMNDNTASIYAVAAGPNSPASGTDVAQPGGVAWSNPGNILAPDNAFATVALSSPVTPANVGPNNPSQVVPDPIRPGNWTGPIGIFALDGVYASTPIQGGTQSQQLIGGGYGFAIPANANIVGIQAAVTVKASANGAIVDSNVFLTQGATSPTPVGTNHKGNGGSGQVTSINVINGGQYLTNTVSVNIFGGGGSGATATATMTQTGMTSFGAPIYSVSFITVNNHGSGYTTAPSVSFSGGVFNGNNATASASIFSPGFAITTSPQTIIYGSPTDLWGVNNWTPALINQSWFGLAIQWANALGINNFTTVFVDCIQITVYYTTFPPVVSDYLEAKQFGFSLPGGATLAGIQVDILGFQTANFATGNLTAEISCGLLKAGTLATPLFPQQLLLSNGYITFGGPTNLFLPSSFVAADINNVNFGVVIQASGGGAAVNFNIDYVRVTVYYYAGSPVTGYVLVSGAADKLYVNNTQVDSGYSQSRLAMVPFRPDASVRPWMYIGDRNKMSKVSSSSQLFKMGIQEPQNQPTLATTGVGTLNAQYWYAYRYRSSATGARSNLSPINPNSGGGNDITPANQNVSVTCTASVDPQVDLIDVFRFGNGLLQYTYIGTAQNASPVYVDTLSDNLVVNNEQATFDDFEPFPSIDVPQIGTLTVAAGAHAGLVTLTQASGSTFNVRWLGGTIITLGTGSGSTQVSLFNRPSSPTAAIGLIEPIGAAIAPGTYTFNIIAPNLAAQPLSAFWGPTDNAAYMFACQDPLRPGTLYFTKGNNPDSAPQSNQIEVTSPTEPLIGGTIVGGVGIVMSTERGWLLYPNFSQATATVVGVSGQIFQPIETITERGLWCKEGITTDGFGMMFYIAKDGIRSSQGGAGSKSITDDIDNLFPHEGVTQKPYTIAGYTVQPPDYSQPDGMALRFSQGYLYFDYIGLDGGRYTLKYQVSREAWSVDRYNAVATVHADNEGLGTVGSPALLAIGVLMGCADSTIRQLSSAATETGALVTVLTPSVGGAARAQKHFGDIYVESSFPVATNQWSMSLWTGRYTQQQPAGTIAPAQLTVSTSRNRVGTIVEINGGTGIFTRDVALVFTCGLVAPGISGDGTPVYPAIYFWEPTLIEQPEDTGLRVTDWDDANYPGAKFVQGVIIEADTAGMLKTFHVESGDDQSTQTLAELGAGVRFQNQSRISFSFATPFIAHNMRLVPDDTVPWRLFSLRWVYVPIPELCSEWHTESTGHGINGWQHLRDLTVEHISTSDLTLTLVADTGAQAKIIIPNSGGVQVKSYVPVPGSWSDPTGQISMSPKFRLVAYNWTSGNPFRLWKEDLQVSVGQWGRQSEFATLKPFGGDSSSQEAEV